jgi:uncharacterized membrane protein YhhN
VNAPAAALLALAALVALANWWSRWRDDERLEERTKPVVTVLLVVAAAVLDADPNGARWWFVAALVCCLAGDVALLPRVDRFPVGLGSFLAGHVLFAAGAVVIGVRWAWLVLPLVVVGALGALVVRPMLRGAGGLAPAVVAYFVAIGVSGSMVAVTGRPWALVGATAFTVSDSILGWNRFVRPVRWAPVAVMVTYHLALLGLVLALLP